MLVPPRFPKECVINFVDQIKITINMQLRGDSKGETPFQIVGKDVFVFQDGHWNVCLAIWSG